MKSVNSFKRPLRFSLEKLPEVAQSILSKIQKPARIFFIGEVGAGKTTLIREICKQLGITVGISSPSYTYINEYSVPGLRVAHIDLYRGGVLDIDELTEHDKFDYVFVEWPKSDPSCCDLIVNIAIVGETEREVFFT